MKRKIGISVVTAAIIGAGIVLSGCGGGGASAPLTKVVNLSNVTFGNTKVNATGLQLICTKADGSTTIIPDDTDPTKADGKYDVPSDCQTLVLDKNMNGKEDKNDFKVVLQNGQYTLLSAGANPEDINNAKKAAAKVTGVNTQEAENIVEGIQSGTVKETNTTKIENAVLTYTVANLAPVDPELAQSVTTVKDVNDLQTTLLNAIPVTLQTKFSNAFKELKNATTVEDIKKAVEHIFTLLQDILKCKAAPDNVLLVNNAVKIGNEVVRYTISEDGTTGNFGKITLNHPGSIEDFYHIVAKVQEASLACKDDNYTATLSATVSKEGTNKSLTFKIEDIKIKIDNNAEHKVKVTIPANAPVTAINQGVVGLNDLISDNGGFVTAYVNKPLTNYDFDVNVQTLISDLAKSSGNTKKLQQALERMNEYLSRNGVYNVTLKIDTTLPVSPKEISGQVEVVAPASSSSSSSESTSSSSSSATTSSSSSSEGEQCPSGYKMGDESMEGYTSQEPCYKDTPFGTVWEKPVIKTESLGSGD